MSLIPKIDTVALRALYDEGVSEVGDASNGMLPVHRLALRGDTPASVDIEEWLAQLPESTRKRFENVGTQFRQRAEARPEDGGFSPGRANYDRTRFNSFHYEDNLSLLSSLVARLTTLEKEYFDAFEKNHAQLSELDAFKLEVNQLSSHSQHFEDFFKVSSKANAFSLSDGEVKPILSQEQSNEQKRLLDEKLQHIKSVLSELQAFRNAPQHPLNRQDQYAISEIKLRELQYDVIEVMQAVRAGVLEIFGTDLNEEISEEDKRYGPVELSRRWVRKAGRKLRELTFHDETVIVPFSLSKASKFKGSRILDSMFSFSLDDQLASLPGVNHRILGLSVSVLCKNDDPEIRNGDDQRAGSVLSIKLTSKIGSLILSTNAKPYRHMDFASEGSKTVTGQNLLRNRSPGNQLTEIEITPISSDFPGVMKDSSPADKKIDMLKISDVILTLKIKYSAQ